MKSASRKNPYGGQGPLGYPVAGNKEEKQGTRSRQYIMDQTRGHGYTTSRVRNGRKLEEKRKESTFSRDLSGFRDVTEMGNKNEALPPPPLTPYRGSQIDEKREHLSFSNMDQT